MNPLAHYRHPSRAIPFGMSRSSTYNHLSATISSRRQQDDWYWSLYKSRQRRDFIPLPKCAPSKIQRTSPVASFGALDIIPTEILFEILEYLDFRSLCQVSRTCFRGKELVESLPYIEYMYKFDKKVLLVMRATDGLLSEFPARLLVSALESRTCQFCGKIPQDKRNIVNVNSCRRACLDCYKDKTGRVLWPRMLTCFQNTHIRGDYRKCLVFHVGSRFYPRPLRCYDLDDTDLQEPKPPTVWFNWGSAGTSPFPFNRFCNSNESFTLMPGPEEGWLLGTGR
ncbi:hypothetical protein V8F20_005777 [Naviculisporaceae sp. PSN 640]